MKRLFTFVLLSLGSCLSAKAQQFDPQILILSPGKVSYDPALKHEIEKKNAEIRKMSAQGVAPAEKDEAANIKLMQQSVAAYVKNLNFIKTASFYSQSYLTYGFYEHMPNCLILLKDTVAGDKVGDLQEISAAQNMTFVLNFSAISFYVEKGEKFCKMSIQLYDRQSNSLLLNKEYKGDWNNHGFEFTCDDKSVGCTVNNALSLALSDVIKSVAANSATLKDERALAEKRAAYIESVVYRQPVDSSLIRQVIPRDSSKINIGDLYQCLYDNSRSKFVGFFIKKSTKKGSLLNDKDDANVKVVSSKDIHDKDYLDQSPGMYAYVVKGIKYNGKWYFEKSDVTYFDAENIDEGKLEYLNNLQGWDYFAGTGAEPSPDFWEGKLFRKIEDKRKDPKWEKYKDIWESEERGNREYIGMYEIVADKLKQAKKTEDENFRKWILKNVLLPFYREQAKAHLHHFVKVKDTAVYYNLIYPNDHRIILNPMKIVDERGVIRVRYFVLLATTNEIFEWRLPKPHFVTETNYMSDGVDATIKAYTQWDYSYDTLDDDKFWNEWVLAKNDKGGYKYLIKLK